MRHLLFAALAVVAGCKEEARPVAALDAIAPPTAEASTGAPVSPSASAAVAASAVAPSYADEHWMLEGLSSDRSRALLLQLVNHRPGFTRFRVVDLSSGATLDDVELPGLSALPFETIDDDGTTAPSLDRALRAPDIEADLVRAAKLLAPFPAGAERVAAAADGSSVAFNAGDWIYLAGGDGKVRKRVAAQASYEPWFTPDGKRLFFRRMNGMLDGVEARYELFAVPADSSAPARRIDGSAETRMHPAVSADGRSAVAIASHEPQVKTCLVTVSLDAAPTAKRVGCLDGGETFHEAALSPSGRWAAVATRRETSEDDPGLIHVDADGGRHPMKKVAFRLRIFGSGDPSRVRELPAERGWAVVAISDAGLLVRRSSAGAITTYDAATGATRTLARTMPYTVGIFRGPNEVVYVERGAVRVIDVTKEP